MFIIRIERYILLKSDPKHPLLKQREGEVWKKKTRKSSSSPWEICRRKKTSSSSFRVGPFPRCFSFSSLPLVASIIPRNTRYTRFHFLLRDLPARTVSSARATSSRASRANAVSTFFPSTMVTPFFGKKSWFLICFWWLIPHRRITDNRVYR